MTFRLTVQRGVGLCWCLASTLAASGWAETTSPPPKPERMEIDVRVDFGPAARPLREAHLAVDQGSTPKDVLSLLVPIESGAICCNTREVAVIDGIRSDPAKNRWWICQVNGSRKINPFQTGVKAGDAVEWIYREDSQ